jgi:hypothetical protein
MGDIQDEIEIKAEEVKDSSDDQHLGDAMDDAGPGAGSDDGSDDGGSLGTPSELPEEASPGADQEVNEAVSGGGIVDPSIEDEAEDTVDAD